MLDQSTISRFTRVITAAGALVLAVSTTIAQVSTAFTYQGELQNAAESATGEYDLEFRLLDADTGGTVLAGAVTVDNVALASAGNMCEPASFSGTYDRVGASDSVSIAVYEIDIGDDLGFGEPAPDRIELQFLGEGYEATGTFDLGTGDNANFETCTQCVLVIQDIGTDTEKSLFQSAGMMHIHSSTTPGPSPVLDVSYDGLIIEEVTIDDDWVSTPVVGGECYQSGLLFRDDFEP